MNPRFLAWDVGILKVSLTEMKKEMTGMAFGGMSKIDQGDLTKRLKVKKTFFYMGALSHESKFKVLARTLGTSPNMQLG